MTQGHLIDFNDLTKEDWQQLYDLACDIKASPDDFNKSCVNKIIATMFYEPSTRTMLSFQAAMLRLGGNVIGFDNPGVSSVAKGENLKDTVRTVGNYSDISVIRSPFEGAAFAASLFSERPIINAGDGGHMHPTQTLADLFTLKSEKGTLSNLDIGLCGDLKNGRTVHSLLKAMTRFKDNRFYLISTHELRVPEYIKSTLLDAGNKFYEINSIEECIGSLDMLYMTRIQKERFSSESQYEKQKNVYCLDMKKLKSAKEDMIILHPLPKVDEIEYDVDFDKRALYFKQAKNGMYIRMALIIKMLEKGCEKPVKIIGGDKLRRCPNPACITNTEKYLPSLLKETNIYGRKTLACRYCDFNVT